MRKAAIKVNDVLAGFLTEDDNGYHFAYTREYLGMPDAKPASMTLPLQAAPFHSPILFSFFDGLIPEGWLLEIAVQNWKVNPRDRMGLLITCCRDCIGNVSVEEITVEHD